MAKTGDDCYFFYYQTCIKGEACPFRHVEEARSSSVTCENWRLNRCQAVSCHYRHMELQQNTPCFYENQPGGCTKPNCQFRHKFNKQPSEQPVLVSVATTQAKNVAPQPPLSGPVPAMFNHPPPGLGWPGPGMPSLPLPHMFPGPPVSGPPRTMAPGFVPFHPGGPVPGNVRMMQIEPVIINPNEESDQDSIKGSPMKVVTRSVMPSAAPAPVQTQSTNPLDYFLNAKPWVDTNQRNVLKRSPSPRRSSPYRKEGSASPRRSQSPRRSLSPDTSRRRSVSAERYSSTVRRRSGSLDRSRSPDWRDRRRFNRRSSRSPPRRRSRSPDRNRGRGVLNRFRPESRGQKLQEVRVTGSKIISIKKDRKDEKDQDDGDKEKEEEKKEEKVKSKEPTKAAPVIKEEVKSLEDIYRERALLSLMEAKRKKILENKRKRWENVGSQKKSESEKSDKSGKQSGDEESQSTKDADQSAVDEKGDNKTEEVDSSSDSPDDDGDNKSDIDLPDDIDIEIGEGELESDREGSEKSEARSDKDYESHDSEEDVNEKPNKKTKSSVTVPAKPSIKSRLGLKTIDAVQERRVQSKSQSGGTKRSVKDRLGIKPNTESEKQVRSGVIKLNRNKREDDLMSKIRSNRNIRERNRESKNVLIVPQITIKNQLDIEGRKAGIKQRLGLLDDEERDSDSKKERRKRKGIDGELMKLLREEEADIEEEDLELLSKKEKKKLLKRLLAQQGREEEYELLRKKKKKGLRKKKEHSDEEEDSQSKRRINIQSRHRKKEADDLEEEVDIEDDLPSEDEIELEEATPDIEETSHKKEAEDEADIHSKQSDEEEIRKVVPVKSLDDIQREREEKEAKLREALEPKSLDDIRKERALKKSMPGDARIKIAAGQNKRKIIMEEAQPAKTSDPPVRITFTGMDSAPVRKLIRLGKRPEQDENDQPAESKSFRPFKRERQIYVPPTIKRTDPPVVVTKTSGPPKGREIVDYGDMFPKKSTSQDDVGEKKNKVKLITSASESDLSARPRLKLQKGPPKVEVKDATVKTFAEIMAEKKRKRLLAQQGKPYTPITLDDTESSQGSVSVSGDDRISPLTTEPRFASISSNSQNSSSPVKSQTLTKSTSSSNIQQTENKPTRWKRRKLSNPVIELSEESVEKSQDTNVESIKDSQNSQEKSDTTFTGTVEKVDESGFQEEFSSQKSSPSPVKRELSGSASESKPSEEKKKKKTSDSFMDFDDDLLNIDDDVDDLDLDIEGGNQDPDELMREIDELLS